MLSRIRDTIKLRTRLRQLPSKIRQSAGSWFFGLGRSLLGYDQPRVIWFDVGANRGQTTLSIAKSDPKIMVYDFEPNLELALDLMREAPDNYVVLPVAVADFDGQAELHVTAYDPTSSLLPPNPDFDWEIDNVDEMKEVVRRVTVPVLRLDTFMEKLQLGTVDYMKIDAQGLDLAVLKSAGDRLRHFKKIMLEVITSPVDMYEGECTKEDVVEFMEMAGFSLVEVSILPPGIAEDLTFVRSDLVT